MKKLFSILSVITIASLIPVIHQEIAGCSTFGWSHLMSSAVSTPDQCSTAILAIPLIPGVLLSVLFHTDSVYFNFALVFASTILIYAGLGILFRRISQ